MNKIFKLFSGTLLVTMAFTACSQDKFDAPDQNSIPTISGVDILLDVDQTVNQATYSATGLPKGTYPIWVLDGTKYSTLTEGAYANSKAGTHTLELRLGNKNGFSQGSVTKSFTFDNTIIDFTSYINRITGEWRINYAEAGHMGCGDVGTDGSGWWSAAPNEKADWGVYDDRITFTADGKYTYNPGEGGTVYVNKDVNAFSQFNTNDGNDYMAEVSEQNATYSFDADGDKILLRLPAGTLFPYISSDAQYNAPVFTVSKLTNTDMTLLYEGDGITWRFMLTTKDPNDVPDEPEEKVTWVAVDSPENLGAGFNTAGTMGFWWANAGWEQIADPGFSYANGVYTVTAGENGGSEWQAQCTITGVPLKIEKGQGYDVSVKIKASADLGRVTVKVNKDPDVQNDPNTLCYKGNFSLNQGENVLTFINVVAKNGEEEIEFDQGKIIFDFGGAPAGFVAEISDIIIQKHQVDNTNPANVDWSAYDSADNIGAGFNTAGKMGFWWANASWEQVGDPGFSYADGVYTVTAVENGGSEWQAQCNITGVPLKIEKGQMYDVSVDIEASSDLPRVTVKVNKDPDVQNDPNTLCYKGDFSLEQGPNTLQFAGVIAKNGEEEIEFDQGKIIFDFGGAPAGFEAKISKIIIQKHKVK